MPARSKGPQGGSQAGSQAGSGGRPNGGPKPGPNGGKKKKRARGIPIGWTSSSPRTPIGFPQPPSKPERRKSIHYNGDGHLLTCAPTGAGKGRSNMIPTLLTYPGSTLTIDLKGENFHVTARRRREMGHRVVVLDPFLVAVTDPDMLNPMDLFNLPGSAADVDCELLADLLGGGIPLTGNDRFWETNGKGMLVGLLGLTAEHPEADKRNLGQMLDYMYEDDVDYTIAVQLDTHKFSNMLARQELTAYLNHESEKCRPSIRSTAQCLLKCLGAESVRKSLSRTTFDLMAWFRGDPIDIYIIFPPDKLDSHRQLLRLLLGTLLTILTRRSEMPEHRTLLLLDEIAQLGPLAHLKTALTLLRGYGVQVWTLWQDLSQLKSVYPGEWESILNNSAIIQSFGMTNGWSAKSIGDVMDMSSAELLRMPRTHQALILPGENPRTTERVDYLTDPQFRGLFDANPRYAKRQGRDRSR
jgi:type IV secretion system protein VirD4